MFRTIINLPSNSVAFLRQVWKELRQMEWLSKGNVAKYTAAVVAVSVVLTIMITGLDLLFVTLRNYLFSL